MNTSVTKNLFKRQICFPKDIEYQISLTLSHQHERASYVAKLSIHLLKENGMPEKCPDAALLSNLLEQQVDLPTLKGNTANSTSSD